MYPLNYAQMATLIPADCWNAFSQRQMYSAKLLYLIYTV